MNVTDRMIFRWEAPTYHKAADAQIADIPRVGASGSDRLYCNRMERLYVGSINAVRVVSAAASMDAAKAELEAAYQDRLAAGTIPKPPA